MKMPGWPGGKKFSKRKLSIVVLVGLALALAFTIHFGLKSPNHSDPVPHTTNSATIHKQEKAGLPVRLKIPKIKVDAAIDYVGLTPQGDMDVPKGPANVAWYKQEPRPGEIGSSVIAGHFGWKDGIPAVFDDLNKLSEGDKLYVEDGKGTIISFVVQRSQSYDPSADTSSVFRSSDGKAHLNLITCEGAWDKTQKSYSKRLVVFADKE